MSAYEERLAAIYPRLVDIYDGHEAHPIEGMTDRCKSETRCDPLGDAMFDVLDAAFVGTEAERWLAAIPDLLHWYCETGADTPRESIEGALRYDAEERLFPDHSLGPVDPATTYDRGVTIKDPT